ncbi:MAG: DUF1926 domain-containing protein, partial [Anaerolineae bacterium]|nr:DUF1926 domain-containing protein [Anaerolineae bacterium]
MAHAIYLALVFHNHQPVGNFDFVNDHGYESAYVPLVELLEKRSGIKAGLHFTGCLLDWLVDRHPEFVKRVKALVARGQVEIMTGGYYEPVLASLRDVDKLGQIRKMTEAVNRWFDTEPKGLWLAERVWEPHLVKPLAEAGVKYVIIDDTHFEYVGFDKDRDLFGYYITEEQGHTLAVFPTLTYLRYSIPWLTVEDNIEWLRQQAGQNLTSLQPKLAFMGDDGEKFGVWPGTYDHCWRDGYMKQLFSAFEANDDWLVTVTPSAYMEQYPALGRAYLPTASYMEMGEWALPPKPSFDLKNLRTDLQEEGNKDMLRFLRGSIWRNFMVKYEEVNHMHKRALHISKVVHAMPEGPKKDQALDLLWAAQSNDPYWHGVFGGIYLFHFRVANYANLIKAEMLAEGENAPMSVKRYDLDLDSHDEITLSSDRFFLAWDLAHGGALREWDYRPAQYNLLNLMTRRDEGYHQDLLAATQEGRILVVTEEHPDLKTIQTDVVRVKERGIERYLIADWYRRGAFIDHFIREDATLEGFYRCAYPEQGDYVILPYQVEWQVEADGSDVVLRRNGRVWIGEWHAPIEVEKRFHVEQGSDTLSVTYTVRNQSDGVVGGIKFAIETALAYDGGQEPDYCVFEIDGARLPLNEVAEHAQVRAYSASTD